MTIRHITESEVLAALRAGGYPPRRIGREWHGRCPCCRKGDDRLRVHVLDGGVLITACRVCGADGPAVWRELGLLPSGSSSSSSAADKPRKACESDPGAVRSSWRCVGPDGERVHHRVDAPGFSKNIWWARGGPSTKRLVYLPGGLGGDKVLIVEGEKCADSAARLLPGWRVVGLVTGAPAVPDPDVLAWAVDGAERVALWPDADDTGRTCMRGCRARLPEDVHLFEVDSDALHGSAPPAGWDAADWRPDGDAPAAFESALQAVERAPAVRMAAPPSSGGIPSALAGAALPVFDGAIPSSAGHGDVARLVWTLSDGRIAFIPEEQTWFGFGVVGWSAVATEHVIGMCMSTAAVSLSGGEKPGRHDNVRVGKSVSDALKAHALVPAAEWDRVPHEIGLPGGGVLDVLSGERWRAEPRHRIRRRASVEPASDAEFERSRFRGLVERLVPDPEERRWLQARLGAALIDAPGMDDLIWLHGPGGAGKGTFLRAVAGAFGAYARGVPVNEIVKGLPKASHPAWLARLAGARLLTADDVPPGHEVEEATVNLLLGSLITARVMRGDPFDFTLNAPLLCTCNAPPGQSSTNVRRLRVIQVAPRSAPEDRTLRAAMTEPEELAAALVWLVVGARAFHAGGQVPESIRVRAEDVADESPIAEFTETFRSGGAVEISRVWERWETFAESEGCPRLASSKRHLVRLLVGAGWERRMGTGGARMLVPPPELPKVAEFSNSQQLGSTNVHGQKCNEVAEVAEDLRTIGSPAHVRTRTRRAVDMEGCATSATQQLCDSTDRGPRGDEPLPSGDAGCRWTCSQCGETGERRLPCSSCGHMPEWARPPADVAAEGERTVELAAADVAWTTSDWPTAAWALGVDPSDEEARCHWVMLRGETLTDPRTKLEPLLLPLAGEAGDDIDEDALSVPWTREEVEGAEPRQGGAERR